MKTNDAESKLRLRNRIHSKKLLHFLKCVHDWPGIYFIHAYLSEDILTIIIV